MYKRQQENGEELSQLCPPLLVRRLVALAAQRSKSNIQRKRHQMPRAEERKAKQPIKSIAFRQKGLIPWRNGCGASMLLNYTDGTQKVITDGIDSFFLAFSGNIIQRPSCYECHFTGTDRISDFTLSDYWGVADTCASEYNLEKGISVLVVNTCLLYTSRSGRNEVE